VARAVTEALLELLLSHRVIPVVVVQELATTLPLARALEAGGLAVAEVTFRTSCAPEAIRLLAHETDVLVGAGTVIRPDQVDAAVEAGARFVVTPGFSAAVVRRCAELEVPVIPGVVTATEVIAALDYGLEVLKLFPAEAVGGVTALKGLAGPFPDVRFVPTGGVSPANLGSYLALPSVAAVGGSWMVAPELVAAGDFDAIERLTADAVALAAEVVR
jgi:2-dehydro-3-deoxyphosphogluconate aldolase / (4S)-4-hydroxy-2-oxoglutarate aldolase